MDSGCHSSYFERAKIVKIIHELSGLIRTGIYKYQEYQGAMRKHSSFVLSVRSTRRIGLQQGRVGNINRDVERLLRK